jgi:DoxX-like family
VTAGPFLSRLETAVRWAVSAFLCYAAVRFLVSGGAAFARLGLSDGARVTLALCEILAAILWAVPRTVRVGAFGLVGVLAWAAGFHFALHQPAGHLFVSMALVAASLAARRRSPEHRSAV